VILLDGESFTLDDLVAVAYGDEQLSLSAVARDRVRAARVVVDEAADHDTPAYGINTGFGNFANVRIPHDSLAELQLNLLRSHAAGVGDPLPVPVVRATMALRANVLAKGFLGIRVETLELLLALINRRGAPGRAVARIGRASGDLAPLAHLGLVLIGEGEAWHDGTREPGAAALARVGLMPASLAPKEGLALINGTQPSTALLGLALAGRCGWRERPTSRRRSVLTACKGRPSRSIPHSRRPGLAGQRTSRKTFAICSPTVRSTPGHANCGRVQDAYSMRCTAQVHGAARDVFGFAHRTFDAEANAATDNPMVFADTGEIVSGGNFHGAPISVAADVLCLGLAQLATISERRSDRLVNPSSSGLPAFLTRHGGLQSGLMMAQVTAAALTSELKTVAHPASVDSIPTSGNTEDHVSMSMAAALKSTRALELARQVIAIEMLCACQAIDLLAPLASSTPLMRVHETIRARVPTLERDRPPSHDIAQITALIEAGDLERACVMKVK
jgi:histidine ammonia-lyase